MNSYHVLELVGEGSFGRVYKGRKKYSGQVVALKFMPKVGRSVRELQNLKREIDIMRDLQHPNIVQLFDSFETDTEVVVVTEYAEGQLFQILEDDGSLPESQVREIACQLVSALYYLHSHRILHRDMKPQNILLDKNGVVKLCDFGFARSMSVSTMVLTSIKGTPLYMSPELVEEKPYDHTADLWSLGCILYELHTGAPPFYTNSILQLVQLIIKDQVKWPDTMSETCTSLLKGLLSKDPQKRLSWPELLYHPFVADNVLVLSDTNIFSPLTVAPSPDMLVLKLKQMAAKTLPTSGESRLLRRVREQREDGSRGKPDGSDSTKKKKKDGPGAERSAPAAASAPAVRPASSNASVTRVSRSGSPKNRGCPRLTHRGQISSDYEREFPSVEVGPRLERKRKEESQNAEERGDYWEKLAEASEDPNRQEELNHRTVLPKLKSTIMAFKARLTGGSAVERRYIHDPLRVLQNLLLTSDPEKMSHIGGEVGLPHVLFHLLRDCLESLQFVQQSWCLDVLGEMMVVLLTYWDNHCNWVEEEEEQNLKEFCKPVLTVLNQPGLSPLAPLAACLLSLFAQHELDARVELERLSCLLRNAVLDSDQPRPPPPGGRGLCDGLLALFVHALCEDEGACGPASPEAILSVNLWQKIGASLSEPMQGADFCSANGLYSLLSAALLVFTKDPYSCIPLFSASESRCVYTLSQLLGTDCLRLFSEGPGGFRADVDHHSCSVLSCHLLCFPFALDLPAHNMAAVLQSYHSAGVVTALLQVIPALPPPLVEMHLSLLIRLLLCDPERAASRLAHAARGFFSDGRGAAALLRELLQQEGLWDAAVELLTLLALVARLARPAGVRVHLEAPVLQRALAHLCEQVRAAACKLLGNLDPFGSAAPPGLRSSDVFRSLIDGLCDSCMSVRRAACRAVGNWLGHIAVATRKHKHTEAGGDTPATVEGEEQRAWLQEARRAAAALASLVTNPDAPTRRHSCAALGNLVNANDAEPVLLQEGVSSLLLTAACTDSHNAVRQAAIATLRLYSKQGAIRQVLVSLGAGEKLLQAAGRHTAAREEYQRLMEELEGGPEAS